MCVSSMVIWWMRRVPAAKPGRDGIDIEIFGMAGIPDEFEREVKGG